MSDIGNLTASLEVDGAAQFTADMQAAADTTKQTTIIIHEQRAAWSQLAASAIPAVGQVAAAGLSLAGTLAVIAHQKAMIATATAPILAAGNALYRYGTIGLRVGAMVVPQLKAIAVAATVVKATWAVATSEFAKDIYSRTLKNLSGEVSRIQTATNSLNTTLRTMASDGLSVVQAAIAGWTEEWGVAETIAGAAAFKVRGYFQAAATGLEYLDAAAKTTQKTMVGLSVILTGGSVNAAADFIEQGEALNRLAAESARVIQLQEDQRGGFELIAQIQREAAESAAHLGEIQRISSLESIEAIDNETRSLQQRAAALNLAGEFDESKLQQFGAMFDALERRRSEVLAGKPQKEQESPVQAVLDAAQKSLDVAKMGQDGFAIATARAKGATEEQIATLQRLQGELATLTAAEEAKRQAEEAARAAQQQQQQMQEQGAERIAALRDQLDLLTKSATNADIVMRELTRQGFSQEQVAEIGRLTEEIDALREQPTGGPTGPTRASAALRGSQEAAQLVLRGVGGAKSAEQLAQKQLTVQQQLLAAVKSNKPQPLLAANF